jgi:hypothetical protein
MAGLPRINLVQEGQKMVNLKILRKRIAITVGLLLVAEILSAAPAFATSEDLTITKVAPTATASDSFPFTVTKAAGSNNPNIYPNGSPSVAFNLDSSNGFTKTFTGFQNATTGVVTFPNNYTITEATPAGWNAPTIICSDTNTNSNQYSNISFNYGTPGSVSFQYTPNAMVPGAHILCKFTNTRMTVVTVATTVSAISIPAGSLGHDSATLTNATGGSLTYNLFAGTCPAQAMNVPIFSSPVSVGNTGVVPDSLSYTFANAGSYYWVAVYTPASGSPIVTGPCEPLTVTPNVTIATTVSAITIPAGSLGHDSATLTNATGGSLTYNLFAGTCPAQAMNVPIFSSPVSVGNTGVVPDSLAYTFANAGSYYWVAVYTPASGSPIVTGPCEPLTVTPNVTIATTVSAITIPAGSLGHDSATLTNATGGSLTYNLFAGTCPAQAMNVPIFSSPVSVGNTGVVPDSLAYTFANAGSYYWVAVYTPASGSPIVTGPCEPLTVTPKLTTTLTVKKIVVPSIGNTDTFTLQVFDPTGLLLANFLNSGNGGVLGPITVTPGNYNVSETGANLSQYTATYSADCFAAGAVTLAAGDNKTCTITNTKKVQATATLRVIKRLLPATGNPNKFNLIIGPSGSLGSGTTANVGNAGTTGAVTIAAGAIYNVSESAGTGGTNLSDYTTVFLGVCAPAGVVNLAANTSGVCIITNTKKARLRVIKKLIPASDPGRFNLKIKLSTVAFNKGNGGSSGFVSVPAGPGYSVGETAANSVTHMSDYTRTYSAGCAPTFVLAPGAIKTCIITNRKKK